MKPTFFLLFMLASQLPAQQQPATPSSKCTIEGLVVKAATGEPLKKAYITLRKAEGREEPYVATTGADGRFVLRDVEPGRYQLWANRSGYVRQEYGQRALERPGTILALDPGQHVRDILFRLIPSAVITGRVYDEDGEPTENISVQALQHRYIRGQRQLVPVGGTATNDLGEYRLHGLPPGQYYVSATYTPGRTAPGGVIVIGRSGEAPRDQGYAPTYYPSTNDPSRATPLALRGGDIATGIDFTLLPTRAVRLRGRVFNAITGLPGRGASLLLMPRETGIRRLFSPNQTFVEDREGNFEIRGVVPGSYTLIAMWFDEGNRYSTRAPIDVGNTDVQGINLVITLGVELAGRVHVEGQEQPLAGAQKAQSAGQVKPEGGLDLTDLRVFVFPKEDLPLGAPFASVKADGSFTLKNVSVGDYRVRVEGLPPDFYLKVARFGGEDALESSLSVAGGQPPGGLELVVSPAGGRIDGTVLNEQRTFSGARIVLVPEPRRRGLPQFYKTTTTDQNGQFTLRGIPPGEYRLFAWEEVELGAYQDPDFLRPYEERGKPVQVEEGSRINFQLELISTERLAR